MVSVVFLVNPLTERVTIPTNNSMKRLFPEYVPGGSSNAGCVCCDGGGLDSGGDFLLLVKNRLMFLNLPKLWLLPIDEFFSYTELTQIT